MEVWRTRKTVPAIEILHEAALAPGMEVTLNLFDDATFTVSHVSSQIMAEQEMWAGIATDAIVAGSAVFALTSTNEIVGVIRHDFRIFVILPHPEAAGLHLIAQVSHEEQGECMNEELGLSHPVPTIPSAPLQAPLEPGPPAPPFPDWHGDINVKLVLSKEVWSESPTTFRAVEFVRIALMEGNLALEQGNVDVRYHVESIVLDPTTEPSLPTNAVGNALTYIESSLYAGPLRGSADLVAYVFQGLPHQGCGAAPYGPDPDNFYSVTRMGCIMSGFTLTHELGHNMGADHDKHLIYGDPNYVSGDYNYGATGSIIEVELCPSPAPPYMSDFCDVRIKRARSIMASASYCQSIGQACPRVLVFSNRGSQFMGTMIGGPNENNTWVHARSAPIVSAYR